jgi:membrane protease YdiL (CAAX protease family)
MTSMRGFVAGLLEPLRAKNARYLLLALVLQGLYWYTVAPAPGAVDSTINSAIGRIAITIVLFLLVPLIAMMWFDKRSLSQLRRHWLTWGDVPAGLLPTVVCSAVAVVALWFGTRDTQLQATYPWAGAWAGASLINLLLWSLLRLAYYSAFEFFYRGFLLETIREHHGLVMAVWLQAGFSFLIHLGTPTAEVIAALPAGFLFATLGLRGRSLAYPILFHWVIGMSTDIFCLYRLGLL